MGTILSTDIAPTLVLSGLISLPSSTAPLAQALVFPAAPTPLALLASRAFTSSPTPALTIALASKPAQLDTSQIPPVDGARNVFQLVLPAIQPPLALNVTPTLRFLTAFASIRPPTTAQPTASYARDQTV